MRTVLVFVMGCLLQVEVLGGEPTPRVTSSLDRYGNSVDPAQESWERMFAERVEKDEREPLERGASVRDREYKSLEKKLEILNNLKAPAWNASKEPREAEELVLSRSLDALPFLLVHVSRRKEVRFGSLADPILTTHPYLTAIIHQYGDAGVGAILDFLARQEATKPADEDLHLFAYGILVHCGFDKQGREVAVQWLSLAEKRNRSTGALDRLRKELLRIERAYR